MNRNVLSRRVLAGVALAALALAGCGGNDDNENEPAAGGNSAAGTDYSNLSGQLQASGASFPEAYYQEVIGAFKEQAPNLTINYNATGSGTGKKQFGQGLVDFAGTDSLVNAEKDGVATGSFLYVPTVAAPITVSFNVQGVDKMQLSPDTVGKIFQGDIKTWNDPAIAADNAGVTLPNTPIVVARRSDGSGTTTNFTKYLEAAAPSWKLGSGDTIAWPASTQGGEKNSGVAQIVKDTNGAIGYVDLSDAKATGLKFAAIKNKDGQFVEPSIEGVTAGLEGAEVAEDLSYNPLNAAGAAAYPITAPTYIIVKTQYDDANKAAAVKGFLTYLLNDGQQLAPEVDFAPLPASLKEKALAQVNKIQG